MLKEIIQRTGKKPSRWAKENNFPVPVILRFLNGKRGISLQTALRLAEALGCTVEEIVTKAPNGG